MVHCQAWNLYDKKKALEMMDSKLASYDQQEAIRMIHVALLCTQASHVMRPPMSRVVNMLFGEIEFSGVISKPSYLTDWEIGESSDAISRNLTAQLEDVKNLDMQKLEGNSFLNSNTSRSMMSNEIQEEGR